MQTAALDSVRKIVVNFLRHGSIFAIGVPLAMMTNIFLAKYLSPAEFGDYGLVISQAAVLAIPIATGMPLFLTKEVSGYIQSHDWGFYRGLIFTALSFWASYISLILFVYLFFWNDGNSVSIYSVCLVPILGLIAIYSGQLRGFARPTSAASPIIIFQPLLLILGIGILSIFDAMSLSSVLTVYICANVLVTIFLFTMLNRLKPTSSLNVRANYSDLNGWIRAFLPFIAIGAVGTFNTQIATLYLGHSVSNEAVAYLRVADRVSQLVVFPLMILETVLAPTIVSFVKNADMKGLSRMARNSARVATLCALSIATIFFLKGEFILELAFGVDYVQFSYEPMLILLATHVALTALGPVGMVLAMGGAHNQSVLAQILGLVVLVVLGYFLIPAYEAVGAAYSAAAGMLTTRLFMSLVAYKKFRIWSGLA